MNCLGCTATTTNGLALCEKCQHAFRVACTDTAAFYADVDRIKPGQRIKVRSAYQSTPPPGFTPGRDPISDALHAAANTAATWARLLVEEHAQITKAPTGTREQLGWLESNVVSIATMSWCGEIVREIKACARRLQNILDSVDTGSYAGVCGNEIGRAWDDGDIITLTCPRDLYRAASAAWVRCPECGRTWDAEERRRVMVAEARDQVAPISVVARAVVGLLDEEHSVEKLANRIQYWIGKKRLHDYGVRVLTSDGKPHRVYRIGDVYDLLKPRDTDTGEVLPDVKAG